MKQKLKGILASKEQGMSLYFVVLLLVAIGVSIQKYFINKTGFETAEFTYTAYNNFVIFKNSFWHLVNDVNMYEHHVLEYYDLYKYSPTFALAMAPFALLPTWLGLMFWNILNVGVFAYALKKVNWETNRKMWLFFIVVTFELITSTQNSQCNVLIVGLLLLTYSHLERGNLLWAALFVMLTVYIKIFGLVALMLFLLYDKRLKSILYVAMWTVMLFILPLTIVSWTELFGQYENWYVMLKNDHDTSVGISVVGIFYKWFGWELKLEALVVGTIILIAPLVRWSKFKNESFRLLMLISVLIWVIIFNHKAESATFIIAVVGVLLWYNSFKRDLVDDILFGSFIVLTVLSPTDLMPRFIRNDYIIPYALKALPCFLFWLRVQQQVWNVMLK